MKEEVAAVSAKHLLERPPEASYLQEWADLLAKQKPIHEEKVLNSVVIFRLAKEWLAFSTVLFSEVTTNRDVHKIPHASSSVLLGAVNLGGQLIPCVSMHRVLEIEPNGDSSATKRMLAIQNNDEKWIFPVDDVFGLFHCDLSRLENVPVTVSKSTANYMRGVFPWMDRSVGFLDEELLFYSLRRSLQ